MSVSAKDLIMFIFNEMRALLHEFENKGVGGAFWCRRVRFDRLRAAAHRVREWEFAKHTFRIARIVL
jgi:hypothetical protein